MSSAGRVTTALAAAGGATLLAGGAVLGVDLVRSADAPLADAPRAGVVAPTTTASPGSPSPRGTTSAPVSAPVAPSPQARRTAAAPTATQPPPAPTRAPTQPPTASPDPTRRAAPSASPTTPPTPTLQPGPPLLQRGDDEPAVKVLQARLAQIGWFDRRPGTLYGPVTEAAVRGFQAKREIPVTGAVDRRTLERLEAMTHEPTRDELDPPDPATQTTTASASSLDPRCRTGRVLCIDKSDRELRWVVDGRVRMSLDVRFGSEFTPTREGTFRVFRKNADGFSSLYETPMPFSMTFSGGQAVHYSADFAARGYDGASHGCVNVRDYDAIRALFGQVQLGDRVVVYWS